MHTPPVPFVQFGLYTRTTALDGVTAFTTLSLFNTLRLPLVILPKCLRSIAEAASAVARLQVRCCPDA